MTQAQFAQTTAEMTRTEALTLALKLAVQAPTQAESDLAVATATQAKKAATASIRRGGVKQ
jgi:hypothetical protein